MDLLKPDWWQVIAGVLVAVSSGVTFWISWGLRRSFVTRDEFSQAEKLNEERDLLTKERLAKLESVVEHLPTSEVVENVRFQLTKMQAEMDGIRDTMNRIDHRLELLYEHLLNKETK